MVWATKHHETRSYPKEASFKNRCLVNSCAKKIWSPFFCGFYTLLNDKNKWPFSPALFWNKQKTHGHNWPWPWILDVVTRACRLAYTWLTGDPWMSRWLDSLKLTASLHLKMDAWKTILSFWGGLFSGANCQFQGVHFLVENGDIPAS